MYFAGSWWVSPKEATGARDSEACSFLLSCSFPRHITEPFTWPLIRLVLCSKTFGLKNKNKSTKVQQYVQQVQKQTVNTEKAKQEANAAKKVMQISHGRTENSAIWYCKILGYKRYKRREIPEHWGQNLLAVASSWDTTQKKDTANLSALPDFWPLVVKDSADPESRSPDLRICTEQEGGWGASTEGAEWPLCPSH